MSSGSRNPSRDARIETGMALMALVVGVVSGLGAVAFRKLIALFHNLFFFGRLDLAYNALEHAAVSRWGALVILVPVIGALGVVFLVRHFAPEAKGHGVPEVIDAVHFKRGYIRAPVAAIKALASSISIGSGGAVGREGPIIQIGATFSSMLARWMRLPEWQRLALIACGGGAGIAATFNTPIGGVLFAAEIMLVEISARTLIPVMIASGSASLIGRLFFGDHPSFVVPPLTLDHTGMAPATALVAYIVLGLVCGAAAMLYTRSIYWAEDLFERMPGNDYLRHVVGMAVVGVMMYLLMRHLGHYYVEGVGYATIQDILDGSLTAGGLVLLLALLKLLATSLTLGSGASGGIFSPALFIGATLGAGFAAGVHALLPGVSLDPANAAVIGMACMVGASTGAAVTAVVMIFEMTRDYHVIIPLIIGVSVAYSMRRVLMVDTIYTLKLSRRGQRIPDSIQSQLYLARRALEFIHAPFVCVTADTSLAGLRRRTGRHLQHVLLEGEDGGVAGVVTRTALRSALRERDPDTPLSVLAEDDIVHADADIQVFDLIALLRRQQARVAVLTPGGGQTAATGVLGVVTWANLVEDTNLSDYLDAGAAGAP